MEPVYSAEWITAQDTRIKTNVLAFMGRDTRFSDSKNDQPLALIVDSFRFRNLEATKDECWNFDSDSYGAVYSESPIKFFEEFPVEVTNPVPRWADMQSCFGAFRFLSTRQIVVGASGRIMSILGAHSVGGLKEFVSTNS
ncbi:MAG: hypothetical protein ACYC7D_10035 [Nitrososphaerales archaeon]